jgi:type IV pilus assembly protein PilX
MPSRIQSNLRSPARQRGAVLIVSLLLLLVMTVLALGASQATRMQERMASNARDTDLAFQSAEAALRTAERLIENPSLTYPFPCVTMTRCQVLDLNVLPADVAYRDRDWWNNFAWSYAPGNTWSAASSASIRGDGLARSDPQFVVEELGVVSPPARGRGPPPPERYFYRITASAEGGSESARVVLQSTYARLF